MADSSNHPFTLIPGGAGDDILRLQVEVEARSRQETAIAELGQAALTGIDPLLLLGQACALVETALETAHCRALEMTPGGRMVVRASIGSNQSFANCAHDEEEDESIGMFVILSDAPITFVTAVDETRFKCSHVRDAHDVACGAGVTIRNQYGRFGVLLAYATEERQFREYQLAFLRSVADIVGQALARNRTETALMHSEARLKQLINAAVDAVVTIDRQGMVIEWNPQAEATFGIPSRDIIGGPLPSSIFSERDYRLIQRIVARRGRAGPRQRPLRRRTESVATRADGQVFPVEITIEAIETSLDRVFAVFIRDISERKRAQQALERSERRFRTIFEKSWSGVALLDEQFHFSFAGSSTTNILGYTETELLTQDLFSFIHPREREVARRMLRMICASPRKEAQGELRFRHKRGTWIWLEGFAQNMLDEPSVGAVVMNYRDVTQRRMTEKQLEYRAHYDALTDLPNRVLFRDRVVNGLAQAHRHRRGLAIMYLDLDHFKTVNDALGHSFGDALLSAVARRLQICLRASDTISRIGGDEFSILINDVEDAGSVGSIARKLLESFSEPFHIEERDIYVTASIGISLSPADGEDVETLVKCADAAMYRAKELGRNQAQLFTSTINERYVRRLATEQNLHQAVDRNELLLRYQPIFDCSHRQITAIEVYVRWHDPRRGVIMPDDFISLAEETGLIIPIGNWVLRHACEAAKKWESFLPQGVRISINVSPSQLQQSDFAKTVRDSLAATGAAAERLQIEITETAATQNIDRTMRTLRELQSMGVATDEQYAFLDRSRCDWVQGHLLGRPMPESEMEEFLRGGGQPLRDLLRPTI